MCAGAIVAYDGDACVFLLQAPAAVSCHPLGLHSSLLGRTFDLWRVELSISEPLSESSSPPQSPTAV